MTLPVSGAISFNNINVELGSAGATQASLGQASYRSLAGVASGAISMSNFYGKSSQFSFSIASNQVNANLRTLAVSAGWDQSSTVVATIDSGVYVYSTSTGTAGLTINGSWPGGITLVNNGYVMGMGGTGSTRSASPTNGGPAISLGVSCTVTNNSYIGGGGGGGGGYTNEGGGGGGAGGGAGGAAVGAGAGGGAGGTIGNSGGDGGWGSAPAGKSSVTVGAGGGGGRVMPGSGGAGGTRTPVGASQRGRGGTAGGGGGAGDTQQNAGAGGSGGSAGGATSGPYTTSAWSCGGGGGWGASGGTATPGTKAGGTGGYAIALNGYTCTRNGSGTTYGTVA